MGLDVITAELLLHEHRYRPIEGRVLLVGRQGVAITPTEMLALLECYGIAPKLEPTAKGGSNVHWMNMQEPTISDVSFFRSFADCTVEAIDISDYEGAEIIHDLNKPVPETLRGQFDFVYDGSCLDNIFDPVRALENISDLIRPNGRLLLYNIANSFSSAYLKFSPDWFMDYFAINDYEDCKVYLNERPPLDSKSYRETSDYKPLLGRMWHYDPLVTYSGQKGYQCSQVYSQNTQYVLCLAEKGMNSSSHHQPIQMHYRGDDKEPYVSMAERFRASPRPIFSARTAKELRGIKSISGFDTLYPLSDWGADWGSVPGRVVESTRTVDLAREIVFRLRTRFRNWLPGNHHKPRS